RLYLSSTLQCSSPTEQTIFVPPASRAPRIIRILLYLSPPFAGLLTASPPARSLRRPAQHTAAQRQRRGDDLVHVVIAVFAQPSAEEDVRLARGLLLIPGEQFVVLCVVDGIVRLVAGLPCRRVLPGDDRLFLARGREELVLDDAGEGRLPVGVVD